jgi:hypothetical protein
MRDIMAIAYMILFPGIVAVFIWLTTEVGISNMEALGVGTIIGVMLKAFSDMWQFYFRKKESD